MEAPRSAPRGDATDAPPRRKPLVRRPLAEDAAPPPSASTVASADDASPRKVKLVRRPALPPPSPSASPSPPRDPLARDDDDDEDDHDRASPAVPKMTIKIRKAPDDAEAEGPLRMTIKLHPQQQQQQQSSEENGPEAEPSPAPLVPKLTIKIPPEERRDADEGEFESDSDDWRAFASRVRAKESLSLKNFSKLKSKLQREDFRIRSPKRFARQDEQSATAPLEIETRCSLDAQGSGQESPRIILKINNTGQGPTSEILTQRSEPEEPHVPKLTIRLEQDPLVCPIKLKLGDGGRAEIVGSDDARRQKRAQSEQREERSEAKRARESATPPPNANANANGEIPARKSHKKMVPERMRPHRPVEEEERAVAFDECSSSQECMIIDDLSQDPLDIKTAMSPSPIVIEEQSEAISEPLVALAITPRRGRGRPRKIRVDTPTVETPPVPFERNLRRSKTPREIVTTVTRTPRGRGRSRGARRGVSRISLEIASIIPVVVPEPIPVASDSASVDGDAKETDSGSEASVGKSDSDQGDDSDAESADSELSATDAASPADFPPDGVVVARGRGRGRGSRGVRRARGGRTPRSARGARGGARGGRVGKFYEEVQVQDALPSRETKVINSRSRAAAASAPIIELFEEETRMIGDNDTPLRNTTLLDDESRGSNESPVHNSNSKCKKSRLMEILDEGVKVWTAADVCEYDWPPECCTPDSPPQTYMIQEQVALYLGIKSFKRKYPDLHRKPLEPEEKQFLLGRSLISEAMCELGVTAVDAGEVLDIMFTDFPAKYEEYRQHLRETRDTRAANKPPPQLTTERSKQETIERAVQSASTWNARFNRQRRTMRAAAVDLQTLTLHRPRKPPTVVDPPPSISYYPVALLPGQYTDYYRHYTPDELRYFPLNTVLSGVRSPSRVEDGADSPSEESADDSEAIDSSSDGSDSESSERNFKRRNVNSKTKKVVSSVFNDISRPPSPSGNLAQSHSVPSPLPPPPPVEVARCKLCNGTEHANRRYPTETFITCASCHKKIHPSCLEMTANVAKCVRLYSWQCPDCKCCARCEDLADDDKMLFCDLCDRGYHIYCVGLKRVPTGRWHCGHCAICRSCGARSPSGPSNAPNPTNGPPEQWHHHLKKASSGTKVYSHTLCGPCARAWRAGRYCSLCERCFMGKKGALKVVICVNCDRTHHKECVRQPGRTLDVLNYMCNSCRRGNTPRRHAVPKKKPIRRISQPSTPRDVINDSVSNSVQSVVQTEAVSMDLSVDSMCTNDSNHQSNSNTYDGAFEESSVNKSLNHASNTPVKEAENRIPRRLAPEPRKINNSNDTNSIRPTNNHIKENNVCVNNKSVPNENNSVNLVAAENKNSINKFNLNESMDLKKLALMKSMAELGKQSFNSNIGGKFAPLIDAPVDVDVQYGNDNGNV